MVPVLEDVPNRNLEELAAEQRQLVEAVLEDEYAPSDLQDGTFTVTNVGVFDMDISYSIINPPQVAILALGRRKQIPVERDGDVAFERAITFSLTIIVPSDALTSMGQKNPSREPYQSVGNRSSGIHHPRVRCVRSPDRLLATLLVLVDISDAVDVATLL